MTLGYGAVLRGLCLLRRDVELPQGAGNYFCGIDCHIANSVVRIQVMSPPQEELERRPANEKIVVVQLKTWFDPSTISPHRGNGPLMPGVVLETPPDANDFRLVLTSAEDLDAAIGGHEISAFRGKAYFAIRGTLAAPTQTPASL